MLDSVVLWNTMDLGYLTIQVAHALAKGTLKAGQPTFAGGRLGYLEEVGLGYLSLDRTLRTLSGGEAQRVALTSSLGSNLVHMLYVLDEPSVGLHPSDVQPLVHTIARLRQVLKAEPGISDALAVDRAGFVIDQLLDCIRMIRLTEPYADSVAGQQVSEETVRGSVELRDRDNVGSQLGHIENSIVNGRLSAADAESFKAALELACGKPLTIVSAPAINWKLQALVDAPAAVEGKTLVLRYVKPDENRHGGGFKVEELPTPGAP